MVAVWHGEALSISRDSRFRARFGVCECKGRARASPLSSGSFRAHRSSARGEVREMPARPRGVVC